MSILITGGAGFIGSSLVTLLNEQGFTDLILADNFLKPDKDRYLKGKKFSKKVESADLFSFLSREEDVIDFVFHLGGRTAFQSDFENQNLKYPQQLFQWCCRHRIPMVFASTSSTYGQGELGYADDESLIGKLVPTNPYGVSKNDFDKWVLGQPGNCPYAGLKIFNVFGPNEFHKGQSISVAVKTYLEIKESGGVELYGSSSPAYGAGEQLRDFIYVKDVAKVFFWFLKRWLASKETFPSGFYNLGTGVGRSFNDVANAVFNAMGVPANIRYRDIPEHVRPGYRNEVVAPMQKLFSAGYTERMYSLEAAIDDLVKNYLEKGLYL